MVPLLWPNVEVDQLRHYRLRAYRNIQGAEVDNKSQVILFRSETLRSRHGGKEEGSLIARRRQRAPS